VGLQETGQVSSSAGVIGGDAGVHDEKTHAHILSVSVKGRIFNCRHAIYLFN
jgi:hypothetical protein